MSPGQHRIVGLQAHAEIGNPVRHQAGAHGEGSELNVDTRLDLSKLEALPHLKDPFLVFQGGESIEDPRGRQDRQPRDRISPEEASEEQRIQVEAVIPVLVRDEDGVDLLMGQITLQVRQYGHAEVEDQAVPPVSNKEPVGCAPRGGPSTRCAQDCQLHRGIVLR